MTALHEQVGGNHYRDGVEDLRKARHFIDLLISLETKSEKP